MKHEIIPVARKNMVQQNLNDELLVYDIDRNMAFSLNQTARIVWQSCDGNNSVADIKNILSRETSSRVDADFIWLTLEELKNKNLLRNPEKLPNKFSGLSRREVIRTIGLSAAISLPVINSVIAPTSLSAQSGCVAPTTPVGNPSGVPNIGPTSCDQFDPLCCNMDAGVTFTVGGTAFCGCSPTPAP